MGESSSPCLVRSFSQPSQEHNNEGDPLRALTTSVSFGRFMSESLAWEKWSSFTHNRYLEEVEKFAKPGSVAEKKAYFEAQLKRAAAKKAAALLEQQNAAVGESSNLNVTNENNDHSMVNSQMTGTSSCVKAAALLEQQNAAVGESCNLNVTNENNDYSTVNSDLTGTSSCVGNEETQREEGHQNVASQTIDDCQMESELTENGSYGGIEEAQGEEDHLNVTNPDIDHCIMHSELPENSSHASIEEVQEDKGIHTFTCGSYPTYEETDDTENSNKQSNTIETEVKSLNQPEDVVEVSENIAQLMEKTQPKGIEEVQGGERFNTSTCGSFPTHEENNLGTVETENSTEQSYPVENEVKSLDQPKDAVEVGENIAQLKKKTQPKNAARGRDSVLSMKKKPLSYTTRLTNNNESSKFRSHVKPMTTLQPKVKAQTKNAAMGRDSVLSLKKKPASLTTVSTSNNESSKFTSRVKPTTALQPKVKTQTKNTAMKEDSVLLTKKKPLSSTSRLTNNCESSKFRSRAKATTALQPKVTEKCAPTSTKNGKPLSSTSRLTNNCESSKFRSRAKATTALQPKVTEKCAPTSTKNGKDLIDKKQSNPKSLHMSIKVSSHKEEKKKILSPILEKIVSSTRLVKSISKTSRDGNVQQTPIQASESGISKHPSMTPQQERRNFKSSNKHGSKVACSPTVITPFSLRSEERAAKRREFFQKLQQKLNSEGAEKEQLHAKPKVKATTSSSKVLASRAKPNASIHHERESSSNHMKKEKPTSSSKVLTSRPNPNASIHRERESSSNHIKKEKTTCNSKVLTSRAKPNASIHHERETSSNHIKKEEATSSFKVLTSRAKQNASIHQKRESSNNQMKKMPRQTCSQKLVSEVQDNKPQQHDGSKDVKGAENNLPKVKVRSPTPKAGDPSESMLENASPNIQV